MSEGRAAGDAARPLAGAGIVVTRPARQAAGLVAQLATLGARPLVVPAIVILPPADRGPLDRAHASLASCAAAIFVSANAAEYGAPPKGQWPAHVRAFAPGPGTAAALAAVGVPEVAVPDTTFDSEGLLALPALRDVRGKRIVIFRGDGGREVLGDTLRERGAQVDYVACYRRAAPASGIDGLAHALRDGHVHAFTVTSSEGLDNLWTLFDATTRERVRRLPFFVPHPRIAERAQALGLTAVVTPGADAGLVAGLLEWFASHPPT
ncbi:MAG: uroporphyrinogen-III synthase [Burkholderiales bacterium]